MVQESYQLFVILEKVLANDNLSSLTHIRAIDILTSVVLFDTKYVRTYMGRLMSKEKELPASIVYEKTCTVDPSGTMLYQLIRRLLVDVDAGVQAQIAEVLKVLLVSQH